MFSFVNRGRFKLKLEINITTAAWKSIDIGYIFVNERVRRVIKLEESKVVFLF